MYLFVNVRLEFFGIFSDSINTYEDVALNARVVAVVESNDVGERIVRQVLQIDGPEILIRAKNEVYSCYVVFF